MSWSAVTTDNVGTPILVDYYDIYRQTDPHFSPVLEDSIASTTKTFYDDFTSALKDTVTNHYYIVKAVDRIGRKSASSSTVGEFDINLINGE